MSEQLESIKSSLMACAMSQMGDLEHTDAKELSMVIDMIKDLAETKYYCAITEAMEKRTENDSTQEKIDTALMMERLRNQENNQGQNFYGGTHPRYPYPFYTDRMYYDGGQGSNYSGMNNGNNSYNNGNNMSSGKSYTQPYSSIPNNMRDYREGRSYMGRKGYMESKEAHESEPVKMDKLEEYIKELGEDITEMIRDASPTEKNTLQDKLMRLAQQIV